MWVYVFLQNWVVFTHYFSGFFPTLLFPPLSSQPLDSHYVYVVTFSGAPEISQTHFPSSAFLVFQSEHF